MEQQGAARGAERQISKFVEDDEVGADQAFGDLAGPAQQFLLLERVDELDGGEDPTALLADKGYGSDAIRADLERRRVDPVIPTKSNRKVPRAISKTGSALRNRIERLVNKIKHSCRAATRYDQLPTSVLGFGTPANIRLWIRFVHGT